MPKRNRVTPWGEIVASPLRGGFMGNRGCLHEGEEIVRRWRTKAWITCALEFRGRRVAQWAPGRYTVLFFHDEAVALAAGHRPCAECRHADYRAFLDAWAAAYVERPRAAEVDAVLHAARTSEQRTHRMPWDRVPDGAFVALDGVPALVVGDVVVGWDETVGYSDVRERPGSGDVDVITPAPTVAALTAGYRPVLAQQALRLVGRSS